MITLVLVLRHSVEKRSKKLHHDLNREEPFPTVIPANCGTILFAVLFSCLQLDAAQVPDPSCLKVCFGFKE